MTVAGPPARVRFVRAPLGAEPTIAEVIRSIDGLTLPFALVGRWGLAAEAAPEARVVIAGAVPSRVAGDDPLDGAPADDPFAVLDDRPELVGEAPTGTIGGGWFGWLAYGLGRSVERTLGPQPWRPAPLPTTRLAWYDDVLRRDEDGVWWVEALVPPDQPTTTIDEAVTRWLGRLAMGEALRRGAAATTTPGLGELRIARGAQAHRAAVAETVERIHAGEIFQANVCLRLEGTVAGGSAGVLAAPVFAATDPWFGAWIGGADDRAIVSASPEVFLRRRGREVTTGPIKGTAPRDHTTGAAADAAAAALLRSEKDRAEHVMIVDLMRNDLGRVCDYGSVRYEDAPRLEPHAGVWHLVSEVGGRLHDGLGDARLLRATFPPGSVTGAPKVQAMRVIGAIEGAGREVYTGAHGYVSPVAGLELAVTIRTIEVAGDRAWIGVGGGIVADSEPDAELAEALTKASALVAAAGGTIEAAGGAGERDGARPGVRRAPPRARPVAAAPWLASSDRRPDPMAGLLTTLSVWDGHAHHAAAHLRRLAASVGALGYGTLPRDLAERVESLAAGGVGPNRLRVLARTRDLRRGKPALGELTTSPVVDIELQLLPMVFDPAAPIDLTPAIVPGGLGPHKWLDRTLVDDLTTRLGASPLLLDADGAVLESGWANVWWLDGDTLCTPPTDGRILPGVTRGVLLGQAAGAVRVATRAARLDEMAELPLLLTSSRGISVARLPTTSAAALNRAAAAAARLAPILVDQR